MTEGLVDTNRVLDTNRVSEAITSVGEHFGGGKGVNARLRGVPIDFTYGAAQRVLTHDEIGFYSAQELERWLGGEYNPDQIAALVGDRRGFFSKRTVRDHRLGGFFAPQEGDILQVRPSLPGIFTGLYILRSHIQKGIPELEASARQHYQLATDYYAYSGAIKPSRLGPRDYRTSSGTHRLSGPENYRMYGVHNKLGDEASQREKELQGELTAFEPLKDVMSLGTEAIRSLMPQLK